MKWIGVDFKQWTKSLVQLFESGDEGFSQFNTGIDMDGEEPKISGWKITEVR